MQGTLLVLEERIASLERTPRRLRLAAVALGLLLALLGIECARRTPGVLDEVRTRRLVVVDDRGQVRVEIAQDRTEWRRSRAAGLTIYDYTGSERGGFGTMDDGSAVFALDAPEGIGSPMRDRLGLIVWPDGSAEIGVNDDQGHRAAALSSRGGAGSVEMFKPDPAPGRLRIRTLTYDGERREAASIDR